jgi:hypothetical protein
MKTTPMVRATDVDLAFLMQVVFVKRKRGNPAKKQERKYLDIITAFDIETSHHPEREESMLYIWQWQFGDFYTVYGRTWSELRLFMQRLLRALDDHGDASLVVLVHNLSYEFQFLRGIYTFQPDEVFAVDSRRVLKCTMADKRLEFRCAMLHSNMSLKQYTKKMHVDHQKLDGDEFDYKELRFPDTPLTDRQLQYCQNDVLGLVEAYQAEMARDKDNLYSVPMTSTGYVRRDCKRAMRFCSSKMIRDLQPDVELYKMLREAFRGGDTHCNRHFAGKVLDNVHSADRSSSYPDVMCNCKFPMGRFYAFDGGIDRATVLYHRGYALLLRVRLWDVSLSDPAWGFPYISYAKCRNTIHPVLDNGRILSAEMLETTITDIDLRILLDQYDFSDIEILTGYHSRYDWLPAPLVRCTIDYYQTKTRLKGVLDEHGHESPFYSKSKNLLNSLYGMMAQDPVKQSILFEEGSDWLFRQKDEPIEDLLNANSKRAFLCYQWGVWVTAWGRFRLQEGLRVADGGHSWPIYCDTDSVKYIGDVDWSKYNQKRMADSLRSGAHATDPHGEEHYMGVYEQEHTANHFVSLGAKKYVTVYEDGKCRCTIAGVNKEKGGAELDKHGGITAFKSGFLFVDAGGTESVYNDDVVPHTEEWQGHRFEMVPNILIRDSTYRVGITQDYEDILSDPDYYLLCKHRFRDK